MTRRATFILTTLLSAVASANEMFAVKLSISIERSKDTAIQTAVAKGTFDNIPLMLTVTAAGAPLAPASISLKVNQYTLAIESQLLANAIDPRLKEIDVVADSGVFGTYFYWTVPFGPLKRCVREGERIRERASLNFNVTSEGELERVSIYDPCGP